MTAIELIPESTTTQPWNDLFEELKTRYPKVREPILAALAVLMQNPDIDVEHAKAVAAANGFRITAASIAAARRLLERQDGDGGQGHKEGQQADRAEHDPRSAPTNAHPRRPGGADPRGRRRAPERGQRRGRAAARRDPEGDRCASGVGGVASHREPSLRAGVEAVGFSPLRRTSKARCTSGR